MIDARQILSKRAFYWLPIKAELCVVKVSKHLFNTHSSNIMQNLMKRTG